MNVTRLPAAAVTTAAFLLALMPLTVPENAWASPSRPGSPSAKSRDDSPRRSLDRAAKPVLLPAAPGERYRETSWNGDDTASVGFEIYDLGDRVVLWNVYRGGQPKGTAGQMIADSLREAEAEQPSVIEIVNIDNPPTVTALASGTHPRDTILGQTLTKAATELGGTIAYPTGWHHDKAYSGKDRITITITYPQD